MQGKIELTGLTANIGHGKTSDYEKGNRRESECSFNSNSKHEKLSLWTDASKKPFFKYQNSRALDLCQKVNVKK